ncbi:hypothetical protein CH379_018365 [Leptospira ellisii]|uniref:Uncharacterized protein n=1 Tax=Leptospira ellisii TaxID=2023197 RepID=A0AAE4QSV2_9LEPT|nr:hypothetical protein [Leptospira ellisii]MDV6237601.1 hypothetical protein [Leptospira ellisii]
MTSKKIISIKFKEIQKEFGRTNEQMAAVLDCSAPMYTLYKNGKQEIPDHRWDRFEEEFDVRREWMQTNKGSKHTKKPNDILAEVGGDAKFLIKLKDLKLATRLSKIPPDVHPKKLKLLHNFLDLYVETFE